MDKLPRYDVLYEYAQQHRLDYNELCRVVREATRTTSKGTSMPPLPAQAMYALFAGPQGAEYRRLSEEWEPDVARHSDNALHARDRQIVELCASIADNTVIAEGSHAYNGGAGTMANSIVAAIRALLGDKGEK